MVVALEYAHFQIAERVVALLVVHVEQRRYLRIHGCDVLHKAFCALLVALLVVMEMYDAYDAAHQAVYAFKASGKVSGAFINIYPPGIPLVVPGEIMNDKLIDDVIKAVNSGLEVDGLYFDPDANMWKFVAVL